LLERIGTLSAVDPPRPKAVFPRCFFFFFFQSPTQSLSRFPISIFPPFFFSPRYRSPFPFPVRVLSQTPFSFFSLRFYSRFFALRAGPLAPLWSAQISSFMPVFLLACFKRSAPPWCVWLAASPVSFFRSAITPLAGKIFPFPPVFPACRFLGFFYPSADVARDKLLGQCPHALPFWTRSGISFISSSPLFR